MENTTPTAEPLEPSHAPAANNAGPYAPWWHTLLLLLWIAFTSWATAVSLHGGTLPKLSMSLRYIETMLMQWIVLLYIWWGLHLRGHKLRDVIGRTWDTFEDALLDVAIAAAFWIGSIAVLAALQKVLGMMDLHSLKDRINNLSVLAPSTVRELLLFFCVAITAGFCEEIIFRGYLQRQFIYATRSAWAGIALSAALFGLAHGYQGPRLMIVLACYGALFGTLAHLRRSVIPGMMTHAWQDALSGALLFGAKYLPIPK
jgi:membrane protease YdiL (CAAX protease family)